MLWAGTAECAEGSAGGTGAKISAAVELLVWGMGWSGTRLWVREEGEAVGWAEEPPELLSGLFEAEGGVEFVGRGGGVRPEV